MIDTPPHADSAARAAAEISALILVPCRPSAFDLAAIPSRRPPNWSSCCRPAFAVFTAGPPNAPRVYEEAGALVEGFGTPPCPIILPSRAAYRHASGEGRTVLESEPAGKAPHYIRQLYAWIGRQTDMFDPRKGHLMSRKPSFANLRGKPTVTRDVVHPETQIGADQENRTPRATSRRNRKQIAGFFAPEMSLALHMLALRQDRSLQSLMAEAFDDVLRKYGESPIGK